MAGKTFEGTVVSNKMEKTLVVSVGRRLRDRLTGKTVSNRKKYKVHCEVPDIHEGDRIAFTECRPLSKDKKFRYVRMVRKSELAELVKDEEANS